MVDSLGIVSDKATAEVTDDFENFVVVVHSVLEVAGRIVKFIGISEVALFELNNLLHQRMIEMMPEVGIVSIEISHRNRYLEFFL